MISELSRSLLEIVWHFGPKGLNGECCDNLTMPEFIALDKVSSTKDCPVQDIGISLGFTKSGATRVVNRLEKKGYVKKIKSHDDARFCCVDITEKGELVLKSTDSRYLCIPVMLTPISSDCDPLALEVLAHLFQRW